jgi:hypothetical protein
MNNRKKILTFAPACGKSTGGDVFDPKPKPQGTP